MPDNWRFHRPGGVPIIIIWEYRSPIRSLCACRDAHADARHSQYANLASTVGPPRVAYGASAFRESTKKARYGIVRALPKQKLPELSTVEQQLCHSYKQTNLSAMDFSNPFSNAKTPQQKKEVCMLPLFFLWLPREHANMVFRCQ